MAFATARVYHRSRSRAKGKNAGRGQGNSERLLKWFYGLSTVVAISAVFGALAGCNRQKNQTPAAETPKRHVLSAVYPLADIVRQVAGERAEVEWFCENGLDPRDVRLSETQQHRARTGIDLIVTSGFDDLWAGDMMGAQQRSERLIRPEATATGRTYREPYGCLWLDPRVAREMAEHYGVKEIAPVNTEPQNLSDDQVVTLKKAAKAEGTNVLAIDAALLPGVRRELELRTGMRLMLLDLVGSSAPEGRSTWIKLMRYNLEELERGLGKE